MNFQVSEHSDQDYGAFYDPNRTWSEWASSTGAGAVAPAAASLWPTSNDTVVLTGIATNVLPLRRGARGAQVAVLQGLLKETGNDPGSVDGDFGPRTEAAVKAFQRARGVQPTGVVDAATLHQLGEMLARVRQGGPRDAHRPPAGAQSTPSLPPGSVVDPTAQAPFYTRPWFVPAAVGTGLVVAAGVGYLLLRGR